MLQAFIDGPFVQIVYLALGVCVGALGIWAEHRLSHDRGLGPFARTVPLCGMLGLRAMFFLGVTTTLTSLLFLWRPEMTQGAGLPVDIKMAIHSRNLLGFTSLCLVVVGLWQSLRRGGAISRYKDRDISQLESGERQAYNSLVTDSTGRQRPPRAMHTEKAKA